jgi:outer membrane protein TolC
MKYFLIIFFLASGFAYGQAPSPSFSNTQRTDSTIRVSDIRERLVQLALQNPSYEVADHNVNIAHYQIKMAKNMPLGLLTAQANVNEYTLFPPTQVVNGEEVTLPQYYPKYNFGLSIPFDIFSRTKNSTKIAKENYYIATAQKNDRFRQIKAEVLTRYEDYLMAKQMVEFQSQITQSEYGAYKRTEKDYQDNLIKLDEVDKAYKNWVSEQIKNITLQRNLNVAKLEIERLIGVKIEDVENGLK